MENIRLLIVDDEESFRSTLAKRLGKRGIVAEMAGSGEQCLALLANKPMDVVVLDVKMPGMTGIEALRRVKQLYPKTEVVLLTGQATAQDGVEGIKAGAFDYLTKPIEIEHLVGKIKQAHDKILWEEEKLREIKFKEKMEQQMIATERLAALGTLAAGVAHEINNPLAVIKESVGWLKLLLGKADTADMPRRADFEKGLNKIEKSIERARKITHQLLGLVKQNDQIFAEVNLKQLVEEAIDLVGREAADKNITFTRPEASRPIAIWSDPFRIRQVLINLLTNAIHATDEKGKIIVTLKDNAEWVMLTVEDSGHGIPKEIQNKIFEPFFTTKSPGEGTGLGLFVSRGMIEKLGGKMHLESRLGSGTTFQIQLPRHYEPKPV